jgi:hypothetical protein
MFCFVFKFFTCLPPHFSCVSFLLHFVMKQWFLLGCLLLLHIILWFNAYMHCSCALFAPHFAYFWVYHVRCKHLDTLLLLYVTQHNTSMIHCCSCWISLWIIYWSCWVTGVSFPLSSWNCFFHMNPVFYSLFPLHQLTITWGGLIFKGQMSMKILTFQTL